MISFLIYHFTHRTVAHSGVMLQAIKKVVTGVQCCLSCLLLVCVLGGCAQQDEFERDQVGNFEALWTIMDEHYSFFE